jgi:NAD-dependent dihydropyrimidine dehydrogenase PreA subunit
MGYAIADPSIGLQNASDADRFTVCIRATRDRRMYYISPDSCVDCSNCVPMYSTLIGRPLKKVTDHVRS